MAEIRDVTDDFAVAPQLFPDEVSALAARFVLLINNRPDGEAPDQPSAAEMRDAAEAAGLRYVHLPVAGQPRPDQIRDMHAAIEAAGGPALAFCRTGTRSIIAWAAGQAAAGRAVHDLEALGTRAGYEIGAPLRALLPGLSG
jgi:uncharacterized protein (TIGR01244 family)